MASAPETRTRTAPGPRAERGVLRAAALDPRDLAHVVVEGLFGLVFPDPHARLRLGLRAVSRAPHEAVSWYVWTTHRQGAFEAAVLPGSARGLSGSAVLALRYFPDPKESLFARFSPAERQARLSPAFDATGTPGIDGAAGLDPSLFHVATLTLVPLDPDHVALRLNTQDRWLEECRGDDGWHRHRDVPGLELALALLDPLVCGLSYLGRRPPACVRAWRRDGLAWRIGPGGRARARRDPQSSEWQLEHHGLLMPGRAGSPFAPPAPPAAAERPFFEHAGDEPPRHLPWPANPQWWQAAGWQFEPVGLFCGRCASEEDGGHAHPPQPFARNPDDGQAP